MEIFIINTKRRTLFKWEPFFRRTFDSNEYFRIDLWNFFLLYFNPNKNEMNALNNALTLSESHLLPKAHRAQKSSVFMISALPLELSFIDRVNQRYHRNCLLLKRDWWFLVEFDIAWHPWKHFGLYGNLISQFFQLWCLSCKTVNKTHFEYHGAYTSQFSSILTLYAWHMIIFICHGSKIMNLLSR